MRVPIPEPRPVAKVPPKPDRGLPADADTVRRKRERTIDEELAQSFPASDPPSWTMGVAPTATKSDDDPGDDFPAATSRGSRASLH
jgi:hypothetical protein